MMIGLLFFAIALNIDALVIAATYGLRKISIPWSSLLILSGVSMAAIGVSMLLGRALVCLISEVAAGYLGGLILVGLGVQVIVEQRREAETALPVKKPEPERGASKEGQLNLALVKLPFVLFRDPELVDLDHSGTIIGWEAFLLGLTLALDAAGAGLAVALQGYSIWLTVLFVGVGQMLFTSWGLHWGNQISNKGWGQWVSISAGVILMLVGVLKIGHCF